MRCTTMGTNLAIALAAAVMAWAVGPATFAKIHLPIVLLGASVGVWLFYVQHQFEATHWDDGERWQRHEAALHGASFYDLPAPLRRLFADVGVHHVHHLASRIPHYRLSLRESLRCVRLALWDEETRRLVPFAAAGPRPA